jgi:excisionase family DNA binding protein
MNMLDRSKPAMTDTDKKVLYPLSDAQSLETLREMARDMQVALYRRYDASEAIKILNVSETELETLRVRGEIAYLLIGEDHVAFFGCQLLIYLLHCVVPVGAAPQPREVVRPVSEPAKPVIHPEAELLSVKDTMALLGIGRTKLYDLLNTNELDCVKIGTRTLIKRTSVRRLTETV